MPAITILLGIALMAVGIGTFATSKEQSLTLLLPALFGLLTLGLGIGSVIKADLRKHLMHAAVLLATLGVLIPVIQLLIFVVNLWQNKRDEALTLLGVLLTVVFCAAYVYAAVQSFKAARAKTKDQPAAQDPPARKPDPPSQDDTPPPSADAPEADPPAEPTNTP